jgi:hypothetical protein
MFKWKGYVESNGLKGSELEINFMGAVHRLNVGRSEVPVVILKGQK